MDNHKMMNNYTDNRIQALDLDDPQPQQRKKRTPPEGEEQDQADNAEKDNEEDLDEET